MELARSAREAARQLQNRPDAQKKPADLMLVDFKNDEASALALIRELNVRQVQVPVIAMVEDRSHENALRVARLVAKGDQMTLEILLSRPVYAIAEENVASMA